MGVAHQVVDEALVVARPLRPASVGDTSRLHDGRVVAHVVHYAHEPVVEHLQRLVEDLLDGGHRGAPRLPLLLSERVYLGLLLGGDGHLVWRTRCALWNVTRSAADVGLRESERPANR